MNFIYLGRDSRRRNQKLLDSIRAKSTITNIRREAMEVPSLSVALVSEVFTKLRLEAFLGAVDDF